MSWLISLIYSFSSVTPSKVSDGSFLQSQKEVKQNRIEDISEISSINESLNTRFKSLFTLHIYTLILLTIY